jgi:hypothetical protein
MNHPHFDPAMPENRYHADPCPAPSLSSTLARALLKQSPRHAWTASPRLNPDHEPRHSEAFDIGHVAHAIVLGKGAAFDVIDAPNWTGKAAREARDDARARGRVPILAEQHERAQRMAYEAAGALADMRLDLGKLQREVCAFAEIDGIWCRAMLDAWDAKNHVIYDYKTCEDASPDAALRSVCSYGYDLQAAHYQAVVKAITGQSPAFFFIFQEKAPPHEVSVISLCDDMGDEADFMAGARDDIARARAIWRDCLARDHWPGYPRVVATLGAPAWHTIRRAEAREKPSDAAMKAAAEMMEIGT